MPAILLTLKIAFAVAAGFVVLLPACVLQAWTAADAPSIKDQRPIDQWKWKWLNPWYANVEDGVSGQQAIIYVDDKGTLGAYSSTFPRRTPKWVIAYCWNARNNANNLKRPLRKDSWA